MNTMSFNQIFIDFIEKSCDNKISNKKNNYVEIVGDFAKPYSIEINEKAELEDNIPKYLIENNKSMICCYKYKLDKFKHDVNQVEKLENPYWNLPINLEKDINFQNFINKGFVIKKNIVKPTFQYEYFNPLPVLIEDLHEIKINNYNLFNHLYLYNKMFRTVMFSGVVTEIRMKYYNVDESTLHATYQVDDGTSNIIMNFKHKTNEKIEDLEIIEKLDDTTTNLLKTSDIQSNGYKHFKSMKTIINTIKSRINDVNNTIKSGQKILVIGVPYKNKYNNKINIRGLHYEYISNNDLRDTTEMFWKNYLIHLYTNNYYKYNIDGQKL